MTEIATPTDEVVETPSGLEDNSSLPEENTNESAVEEVQDTASEVETETGSNDSEAEDEPNKVDPALLKFAKSQGIDTDVELSEREIKALELARKQVQETRKKLEKENKGAVEGAIKSVDKSTELSDRDYLDFRMKQRDMIDDIRQYWVDNPDDKKYETEAILLLNEEKEKYGDDAMIRLVSNMPRLVREAKFAAGAFNEERIKEEGRKLERERLNKLQSGAADGAHATTLEGGDPDKVTAEWVRDTYDPANEEHRKKLDEFLKNGGKVYQLIPERNKIRWQLFQ